MYPILGIAFVVVVVLAIFGAIVKGIYKGKTNAANKKYSNELKAQGFNIEKYVISESAVLYIDDSNKLWSVKQHNKQPVKIFKFSDLKSFEVYDDGRVVKSGSTGGMIIGGLMFGVVGAVIGAGSGGVHEQCSKMYISLCVDEAEKAILLIPIITAPVDRNSNDYKKGVETAEKIVTALAYIQNIQPAEAVSYEVPPADNNDAVYAESTASAGQQTAEDTMRQLAELKDEGIISEDEYNQKRIEILNRL